MDRWGVIEIYLRDYIYRVSYKGHIIFKMEQLNEDYNKNNCIKSL